jgi:hypothetical protein
MFRTGICTLCAVLAATAGPAMADPFESGRLLATSGVTQLEGVGGGGLVPWGLITGYGTQDAVGATVHGTTVWLPDFTLASTGAAVGLFDRAEISYAHEWFDSRQAGGRLGIGNGYTFNLDILGLKLRVLGDAVYDQDRWLPQIAVGTELKQSSDGAVLRAVGARSDKGADFYAAMTKIFLAESLLVDLTVRLTNANQFGLLGFGGDRSDSYHPEVEGSVAYLVSQSIAMGAELRTKPDNLRFAHEGAAFDVFGAYFLTKHASATLAYVGLGDIARQGAQNGVYLSIQVGF